jgi:hypothetical protein
MLIGASLYLFAISIGSQVLLTVSATRNAMLVEQARKDALEMHRASKMDGLRKHVRNVSAKFGKTGFEEDLH